MRKWIITGVVLVTLIAIWYGCAFFGCIPPSGIHKAALDGNLTKIKKLLDQDPNLVNAIERAHWTPLHFAARQGHEEVAELLLARGANINARLKYFGGAPLHVAASTSQKSIVALLLAKGADVNATDDNGWTPLARAVTYGHRDVVERLLAGGADVYAWSYTGVTPIDIATQEGHTEFANLLREHGRSRGGGAFPSADDFAGDCGWPTGENQIFSYGCDQGAYRMGLKKPGPVHVKRNFGWGVQGVNIEVDATVASGRGSEPGAALLGIGCLTDWRQGYLTILNTDGAWAIMRFENGFTQLAGTNKAGGISGLGRANRLQIICENTSSETNIVTFLVNGEKVGSAENEHGYALFNGAMLYTDTFPGVVVFERFVTRDPSE